MRKLAHLQILRAVAASLVVVDHSFGALEYRGVPCGAYIRPGYLLGHLGVSAFFVLSGLIMVRQESGRFGSVQSPLRFAYRRVLRIVPMYWLATLLWFIHSLDWGRAIASPRRQLLLSLFFVPNRLSHDLRMAPVLEPGWTLNYEMGFYVLFCMALFLPRRLGILILLAVPALLVALGSVHRFPADSIAGFYTNAILLPLAYGVAIGWMETEFAALPRIRWRIAPAFLLLLPAALILALPRSLGTWELWGALTFFSALVVAACTLSGEERFGWFGRTLVLLGDASFSTYLFHLFLYESLFNVFAGTARLFRTTVRSPWWFTLAAVVAANLLGLVIHLAVERPLTRGLRRLPFFEARQMAEEPVAGPV